MIVIFPPPQADSDDQYGQCTPDLDEYTKEPPPLPPHLRHIILNKNPPANDPSALPVPQHVVREPLGRYRKIKIKIQK